MSLSWLTNSVLAVIVVTGAAVGVAGALRGTLLPLLEATANIPCWMAISNRSSTRC